MNDQLSKKLETLATTRRLEILTALSGDPIYGTDDPVVHWSAPDGSYGVCRKSELVVVVLTEAEEEDLYTHEGDEYALRDDLLGLAERYPYKRREIQ